MFCQTCSKCCTKSACRGQAKSVFGNLGSLGGRTQSTANVERGLYPTFPDQTKLDKVTDNHQLICASPQEILRVGGIASADKQKCSRVGQKSRTSGLLQQAIFGPKTKQQMETYTRSRQFQQIPQDRKIHNGDTRKDPNLPTDREVGHVHRFQGRLLPYTNTKPIKKISEFSCSRQNIPVQSTTIWPVHSSLGIHCCYQRGQTDGFTEGYKNPPVPKRLVGPGQIPPNLSPAYTNTNSTLSGPRLASKHGNVRTGPQASLQLCRLPV